MNINNFLPHPFILSQNYQCRFVPLYYISSLLYYQKQIFVINQANYKKQRDSENITMRKFLSKQKESSISEKVKKKFRYSPSYQAQKCYSKLPSRYSCTSNNHVKQSHKINDDIICQYSSVKQKNLQTNQCNDTSSWIAKLVNGIQDQDQENKNIQKLSQIQNRSISDLPQDSQDYDYNQFLVQHGQNLFSQKVNLFINQTDKISKQLTKTKPHKKSIKQSLLQIQQKEKQNKQGMRVPPVSRASSMSKRQNNSKKISHKNSIIKVQFQNELAITAQKQCFKKKILKKSTQKSQIKNIKNLQKQKNNFKSSKSLLKAIEKSDQVQNLHKSNCQTKNKKIISKSQVSHNLQTSTINEETKKHSLSKIKISFQQISTRKNSLIHKDQFSESKQQYKIVKQLNDKHINGQNLFTEENQIEKSNKYFENIQNKKLHNYSIQSQSKRVGGIKKNNKKIQNSMDSYLNFHNSHQVYKQEFQASKIQKYSQNCVQKIEQLQINKQNAEQNQIDQIRLKYNYLKSKRQSSQFTLNGKDNQNNKRILIDLQDDDIVASFRRKTTVKVNVQDVYNTKTYNIRTIQKQKSVKKIEQFIEPQRKKSIVIEAFDTKLSYKNSLLQRQNTQIINQLFEKMKLDSKKQKISKNNLKLRGLSQAQKSELGNIIAKIHYQNMEFSFRQFQNQFRKTNVDCLRSGCLSQEKLKLKSQNDQKWKVGQISNLIPQDMIRSTYQDKNQSQNGSLQQTLSFDQNPDQQNLNQNFQPELVGHRRRNSKIIKRKLFQEIKRISYLEQQAIQQLERNSRIQQVQKPKTLDNCVNTLNESELGNNYYANENQRQTSCYEIIQPKLHNVKHFLCESIVQNISKEPYIECPSLMDIEASNLHLQPSIHHMQNHIQQYSDQCTFSAQQLKYKYHLSDEANNYQNIPLKQINTTQNINSNQIIQSSPFQKYSSNNKNMIEKLNQKLTTYIDKNQIENTYRQFNLNFSQLKKHIR